MYVYVYVYLYVYVYVYVHTYVGAFILTCVYVRGIYKYTYLSLDTSMYFGAILGYLAQGSEP